MGDVVSSDVPDSKDVIVGKDIASEQQNQANQQTLTFNNSDNAILWQQMIIQNNNAARSREQLMDKITELFIKIDDLPNRVIRLEGFIRSRVAFAFIIYSLAIVFFIIYLWFTNNYLR